jgi:hypothetical protein
MIWYSSRRRDKFSLSCPLHFVLSLADIPSLRKGIYYLTTRNKTIKFDVHGSVHRRYISKYKQQDATLNNLFISVKFSICFRRYLLPSSGAQNCIYSIGYLSNLYCCLPLSWKSLNCTIPSSSSSRRQFAKNNAKITSETHIYPQ